MEYNTKKRRLYRQYYNAFGLCFFSLSGLFIYLLGKYKIPFPNNLLSNPNIIGTTFKLFSLGLGSHTAVNGIVSVITMFLDANKWDPINWAKLKFWMTRTFLIAISAISGMYFFWDVLAQVSFTQKLLFVMTIVVINCCVIDLIIQMMNNYGLCDGFSLLFLVELIQLEWVSKLEWKGLFFFILILFFFSFFIIFFTNLKWEVPVESNSSPRYKDNKFFAKKQFKLGFKLNFPFMFIYYLSQALSWILDFCLMFSLKGDDKINWLSLSSIFKGLKVAEAKRMIFINESDGASSIGKIGNLGMILLRLNEAKNIFWFKNIENFFKQNKWYLIISGLLILILLKFIAVWLQATKISLEPKQISKDLRLRGIYINKIAPGYKTKKILAKIINKMVVFWFLVQLGCNILFDNIITLITQIGFTNWLACVNVGSEIIEQSRTKLKYIFYE